MRFLFNYTETIGDIKNPKKLKCKPQNYNVILS